MVKPETGQANFSEKVMRPSGAWVASTWRSAACSSAAATPVRSLPAGLLGRRVGRVEESEALGELQRRLEAVGEPALDAFADDDAVDHDLDVMLVFLVERRRVLDGVEFAR